MRPRAVIVGAGAAGMFAAGTALARGCGAVLVEHMDRPGKKLAITGKGRCNLTCAGGAEDFLGGVRRNPKFLYSAAHGLAPDVLMDVFESEMGVPLVTERGRRVFPASGRAEDVVDALRRRCAGAEAVRGRAVEVLCEGGRAAGVRLADGRRVEGSAVLLATGGLSYPATGSTGIGYDMARASGHAIVPPRPSLVALVERGDTAKGMAGLSLRNVALTLLEDGRPVFRGQGELLFTHFGLSGPLVLSASAFTGDFSRRRYEVSIDLKPALTPETLDARVLRDFAAAAGREAAHSLDKLLPRLMRPAVLRVWGVEPKRAVNQITRAERAALCGVLKDFRIPLAARGDLNHAVVTAGGVDVRQVDPRTMQSRLVHGLYFAGEILDTDGYTGGYNLHIAWCTAFAAANAMAAQIENLYSEEGTR